MPPPPIPRAPPILPTKTAFLANQIDVLHECSICHDPFDDKDHAPARLTGDSSCHHVFGLSCLKVWMDSEQPGANKCPYCRKALFRGEDQGIESEEDSDYDESEDEYGPGRRYEGNEVDTLLENGNLVDASNASEYFDDDPGPYDEMTGIGPTAENEGAEEGTGQSDSRSTNGGQDSDGDHEMNDEDGGSDREENHSESTAMSARKPNFRDSAGDSVYMDEELVAIREYSTARPFVESTWCNLYETTEINEIYEIDIEVQIHRAIMQSMVKVCDDKISALFWVIWQHYWPAVLGVAREMIEEHYKNGLLAEFKGAVAYRWVTRMGEALDWDLCRDEYNPSECCQQRYD
jgi:hypothetical protein